MSEFTTTTDPDEPVASARNGQSAIAPIRPTDGERLMRFWRHRDQAAFAEVVEIHAPLVWGVCSQVLRRREDVEDAFQATFLILARKAKSIRAADSAAGWLYRVAFRTALLARNRRQRLAEQPLVDEPASDDDQLENIARNEQCLVLLEELHALPMQYRQPLILCYLEGRSRSEAADELGLTPQSVKGRLARGTRMLRTRLVSRGAALSTTMAVVSASMASAQAGAGPLLVSKTAALGASFALKLSAAGLKATAAKGSAATILAEKGMIAMTIAAASKPAVGILGVCLAAGMLAVATADGPRGAGVGGADTLGAPVVLLAANDAGDDAPTADVELAAGVAVAGEGNSPADVFAPAPQTFERPVAIPQPPIAPVGVNAPPQLIEASLSRMAAPSEKSLALEAEYWAIKARALQKKSDALAAHAKLMQETGKQSPTETLAAEAEAELTLAEVKLCEMNALRVNEQLQAIEADRLKPGSKGVQVSILQQMLNARLQPSPNLNVDGDFGTLTEKAVKLFQEANGLPSDGIVDAATWAVLDVTTVQTFERRAFGQTSEVRTPALPRTETLQSDPPRQSSGYGLPPEAEVSARLKQLKAASEAMQREIKELEANRGR